MLTTSFEEYEGWGVVFSHPASHPKYILTRNMVMKNISYNKNKKHSPTFLALMEYLSKLPQEEFDKACEVVRQKATIELHRRERLKEMK